MKKNPCIDNMTLSDLAKSSKVLHFDTELLKLASQKLFSNQDTTFKCPINSPHCQLCYIEHQKRIHTHFKIT